MKFSLGLCLVLCLAVASQASSPASQNDSGVLATQPEMNESYEEVTTDVSSESQTDAVSQLLGAHRDRRFFEFFKHILRSVVQYFVQWIYGGNPAQSIPQTTVNKQMQGSFDAADQADQTDDGADLIGYKGRRVSPYKASAVKRACKELNDDYGEQNAATRKVMKDTCIGARLHYYKAKRPTPKE